MRGDNPPWRNRKDLGKHKDRVKNMHLDVYRKGTPNRILSESRTDPRSFHLPRNFLLQSPQQWISSSACKVKTYGQLEQLLIATISMLSQLCFALRRLVL